MSLAEDFDSVPVSGKASDTPKSLADDFESTPLHAETAAKADKPVMGVGEILKQVDTGVRQATWHAATSMAGSIASGYKGLFDLALGRGPEKAAEGVQNTQQAATYQPTSPVGQAITQGVVENPQNPMNYVGQAANWAGDKTMDITGSPAASTAVNVGVNAAPMLLTMFKNKGSQVPVDSPGWNEQANVPRETSVPRGTPPANLATPSAPGSIATTSLAPETAKLIESPPVSGGLPPEAHAGRADVLQRIGLDKVRTSAVTGDALNAAADFQTTKFNEAAGVAAKEQFATEQAALQNHAESIVRDTKGTLGLDEDSLHARGQTIAQPFDDLRKHFEQAKGNLYKEADARSQGAPVVQPETVKNLLKDPDFTETLLAKDQGGLLNSIQRQFDRFQQLHPDGLTVESAENFRKWLNKVWTPTNSSTLGQLKGALDEDVAKSAGSDLYAQARSMHALEKQTLDNPKGVAKLMDFDPQTPINRTTPYNKIPDTLSRLDPDQFNNIVKTLQDMPPELQPQAQAAISEIKAQLANKLLEAGSKTQTQWNAPGVTKILNSNSSKFASVFSPEELLKIQDLQQAGNILRVDASYPGAAAQAANATKRGLMANLIQPAARWLGAGAGALVGAPVAGMTAGDVIGAKAAARAGEKGALTQWNKGVTQLSDIPRANP
jgi:hypothetical protein